MDKKLTSADRAARRARFVEMQERLALSNSVMAKVLRKTPQTVSNYRCERQAVPDHVFAMLETYERTRSLSAVATGEAVSAPSP